jgi:predicted Zn-dependent peptidase
MGLIDQILLQGDDALLHQALVKEAGMTDDVSGGINALLGNMLNYKGPMLWTASFIHDSGISRDDVLNVIDGVVEKFSNAPVEQAILDRALVKWRSAYYDEINSYFGVGRADLLATLALFDDNPARINEFEQGMLAVTPELIHKTAIEYLRPTNRTTLVLEAGAAEKEQDNG